MPRPNSGAVPNGVGNGLMVKSQMKPARLLRIANSAMKTTTWLSTGASWIGLKTTRSIAAPATKEIAIVMQEGGPVGHAPCEELPGDEGREHRHLALREIEVVDRLVDHHDGKRHAGVDAAGREPRQDLLEEELHCSSRRKRSDCSSGPSSSLLILRCEQSEPRRTHSADAAPDRRCVLRGSAFSLAPQHEADWSAPTDHDGFHG